MTQETDLPLFSMSPVLGQVLGGESAGTPTTGSVSADGTPVGGGGQAPTGGSNIFFFAIIMMIGMFIIMSFSGRKEKKKRAEMLANLAKRDKIRSAGGIIGTVIEIKKDEVLIETDKSSHTRLWLARGSVSAVIDSSKRPNEESSNEKEEVASA